MNVWLTKLTQDGVCAGPGCGKVIVAGDYALNSVMRQEKTLWHPECWIEYSKELVETVKQVSLGRHRMAISDKQRKYRLSLLRQYAANKQRIARYQKRIAGNSVGSDVLVLRVHRLEAMQQVLRLEMASLGGVPKGWEHARETIG